MSEVPKIQALDQSPELSRREFLKAALWGGAAVSIGSTFLSSEVANAEQSASPENQEAYVPVNRIGGADRFETAQMIINSEYPENHTVQRIAVVTGGKFADAMTVAPLGYAVVPVLGTVPEADKSQYAWHQPSDSLALDSIMRIATLQEETGKRPEVYIVGGSAVVDQAYEDYLSQNGFYVERIAGATRIDTAHEAATHVPGQGNLVVVDASNDNESEVMVAASLAANLGYEIEYIENSTLTQQQKEKFQPWAQNWRVITIGDRAGDCFHSQTGIEPQMSLSSSSPAAMSVEAARYLLTAAGSPERIRAGIATSRTFADSLVAIRKGSIQFLAEPGQTNQQIVDFLHELQSGQIQANTRLSSINIYGGPAAVSADLETQLKTVPAA